MGDLIRHADTSIPGLPSDVAGADVPRELEKLLELDEILGDYGSKRAYLYRKYGDSPPYSTEAENLKAEAKDLLMQRLCSYVVNVQHVALLEGQRRRDGK